MLYDTCILLYYSIIENVSSVFLMFLNVFKGALTPLRTTSGTPV